MVIFQKNLKKNSTVKIKNNKNNKSVIATVGKKADYPHFNNSVVTKRIASAIELDLFSKATIPEKYFDKFLESKSFKLVLLEYEGL